MSPFPRPGQQPLIIIPHQLVTTLGFHDTTKTQSDRSPTKNRIPGRLSDVRTCAMVASPSDCCGQPCASPRKHIATTAGRAQLQAEQE